MADPELQRAYEDVQNLATARRRLTSCTQRLAELRTTMDRLEDRYAREQADVDVLNRTSLRRVLTKIAGNHDEKLAAEEAEVAAARLLVDGHRSRLDQMTTDRNALNQQVMRLSDAPRRLEVALAEAQRRLISSGEPDGQEMLSITESMAQNQALQREHAEAREAGLAAVNAVGLVLATLRKALGWSTGDMFGMPFADWAEHDRLDEAAQLCWQAQRYIDVFAREMADVAIDVNARMPNVDTNRFADFFFDGIIVDSIRHNRIEQTVNYVTQVHQYLEARMSDLSLRRGRLKSTAEALEIRRRKLLGLTDAQ